MRILWTASSILYSVALKKDTDPFMTRLRDSRDRGSSPQSHSCNSLLWPDMCGHKDSEHITGRIFKA